MSVFQEIISNILTISFDKALLLWLIILSIIFFMNYVKAKKEQDFPLEEFYSGVMAKYPNLYIGATPRIGGHNVTDARCLNEVKAVDELLFRHSPIVLWMIAIEDLQNNKNTHEKEITTLKKDKAKLQQELNLRNLTIDDLNKNLETRSASLKRVSSDLTLLKEQQDNNPELIAKLKTTNNEVSAELAKAYSYLQKVLIERSLLLKGTGNLSDYHYALEEVFTTLQKDALTVKLQLLSLLEFKRQQDEVDMKLDLLQQQLYRDNDSIVKLSMTMQMPAVPGTLQDNCKIAEQRHQLIKEVKELKETRTALLEQSSTNTKLEEQQVMNVLNYFQELINNLQTNVEDLQEYLISLQELKRDVAKEELITELSPLRKSIDKDFIDNLKKTLPLLKESVRNPNSNSNVSPDRTRGTGLHSPTELPRQPRRKIKPTEVDGGKKPKASQTSIDTEAHNILDELTQSTSTSPTEVATRQPAPTSRPAEDDSMVNTTHSVTPNVTTLSRQVSPELPSIIPPSDKPAMEVD